MKKLYKSENNKVISGVFGGLGDYYNIDPTILRLGFIIVVIVSGILPGIIAYIIAIFIVPQKPKIHRMEHSEKQESKPKEKKEETKSE